MFVEPRLERSETNFFKGSQLVACQALSPSFNAYHDNLEQLPKVGYRPATEQLRSILWSQRLVNVDQLLWHSPPYLCYI